MFKVFLDKFKRFMCVLMAAFMLMSDVSGAAVQTVHAAAVVPAGVALVELLKTLLVSAGVTYLGYQSLTHASDSMRSELEDAMESDEYIAGVLAEARRWEETDGSSALDPGYSYAGTGFRVIGGGGGSPDDDDDKGVGATLGKMVSITLNAELIRRARDVAKAWADSEANIIKGRYMDETVPDYLTGSWPKTVSYDVRTVSDYDFSELKLFSPEIYDFVTRKGFDDSNSSVLLLEGYKSSFTFLIVPFEATYLTVSSGSYLIRNSVMDDFWNVAGSVYNCLGLFDSIDTFTFGSYCYYYNGSDFESVSNSNSFCLDPPSASVKSNYITFNRLAAVNEGSDLRYLSATKDSLFVYDIVMDTRDNCLIYDESSAKPIPNELTFDIPEDALGGITATDFVTLIDYVNSLVDQLKDSTDNHEDLIEQSKSILDAINNIRTLVHTSANDVGNIAATVVALPALFKQLFSAFPTAAKVESLVTGIPASIAAEIADVFPGADTIADNVASLPADLAKALEGVVITVPDVVIPEIAVPDVAVTLEPTFDITVDNDFKGLADEIALKVEGVLTDVFVPDYTLTLQKFNTIRGYFGFTDNINLAMGAIFDKLWGITPSPYLKIPLGSETSKYNYGFGSYWIIDISWYSTYKNYGDKIILAIVWSFFIWHLFLKLPGVISGAEGQMMSGIHSQQKYNNSKSSKKSKK